MRWIGLYLAAFLLLGFVAAADCAAADPAKHAHDHGKHADPADHHEEHGDPTPADEVSDQTHYHLFKGIHIPLGWWEIGGYKVPTRFMVTELFVAIVVALLFIGLANRVKDGNPVRGRFWNALEAVVLFIRDDVVRPNLDSKHHDHDEHAGDHHGDAHHGHHHPATPRHDGDRYLPYIWTAFLFILGCNLFGLIPFLGSPTANIFVTGALALCSFILLHGSAISKNGLKNYLGSMWMDIDIPPMFGMGVLLGYAIKIMIFFLEFFGTFIKAFVLAVRLFANMFAGHMVVASILSFILLAKEASHILWATVTLASVMGVVALSLLELFVAFLQAYIFVFLTALFTGMATNPEH